MCRASRGVATNGHALRADGADGGTPPLPPCDGGTPSLHSNGADAATTFTAIPARHGLGGWR